MAKKKKTVRSTKASRSRSAKKAARTRATKKAARSRSAKKAAKTRAKKKPKKRNTKKGQPRKTARKAYEPKPKKRNKKPPSAKQLAARAKFIKMVQAKAAAKRNPGGLSAPSAATGAQVGASKRAKAKRSAGTSMKSPRSAAGYAQAMQTAFAQVKAAEERCESAYRKLKKEQSVTKAELDRVKVVLKRAESSIKAFERTIGRLEAGPARVQARKSLARLKSRQRDTTRLVKRTVQYYNTLNKKGQPIKRVRKGGKTKIGTSTRKRLCPPSKAAVKRSARAVRKGEPSGKAMADKRWCGGVKTTEVKRNYWNLKEDLI